MNDIVQRMLRTEFLLTVGALILLGTGRISTVEEAVALIGVVGGYAGGRSVVKAMAHDAET